MTDLADLLARVKEATGADRELDAAIVAELNDAVVKRYPPTDDFGPKDRWQFWSRDEKHFLGSEHKYPVPLYTFSIDAALALVERLLPGWSKQCLFTDSGNSVLLYAPTVPFTAAARGDSGVLSVPTPALAILAALLTALKEDS